MTDILYNGSSLGQVQDIKESTNCGLLPFPMPRTGASETLIYDLNGTSDNISITTKFVSTPQGIGSVLNLLDNICNGQQTSGKSLVLPYSRTKNVVISNWEWYTNSIEGANDAGSNCIITLRIDFAFGTVIDL
jgi:hypothetical protein